MAAFIGCFGLGSRLADDMGLGKTIQLISLLLHESQELGPFRLGLRQRGKKAPAASAALSSSHSS